jgi:hypothetical protein
MSSATRQLRSHACPAPRTDPGGGQDQPGDVVGWEPAEALLELGGNTGYVNGYITANGGPVPNPTSPTTGLRIRAFPLGSGPECGVKGFAASAEQLATSGSGTATFYRTPPLAGGRCGAATQAYSLQVDWLQPNPDQCQVRHIDIADGRGIRVDFVFPSAPCP